MKLNSPRNRISHQLDSSHLDLKAKCQHNNNNYTLHINTTSKSWLIIIHKTNWNNISININKHNEKNTPNKSASRAITDPWSGLNMWIEIKFKISLKQITPKIHLQYHNSTQKIISHYHQLKSNSIFLWNNLPPKFICNI
jgi:hypothetical protein